MSKSKKKKETLLPIAKIAANKVGHIKDDLFMRVVSKLEQARQNVVQAVNSQMVIAYWLIGKEIIEEIQLGEKRASYGKKVIQQLSIQLTKRYGSGFSATNLELFRKLYQVYVDRLPISYPVGTKSEPTQNELALPRQNGFSPKLSWSHYRAIMRIRSLEARLFYENEAIACGWDKRTLERQIHSFYYERMLKSQNPKKLLKEARQEVIKYEPAVDELKNPFVLEFLGLPDVANLHETNLESAVITHLQSFLLELGKGFAFVARQKRMRFDDKDFYVDLVFYNCILKCYLLIDLKMEELTHQDVGQMDSYVRMFEDLHASEDDNPTIGLILCAEKNEAVAKYSVLKDRKQIFASKYLLYLPSEEELVLEIARERKLIEESIASNKKKDN